MSRPICWKRALVKKYETWQDALLNAKVPGNVSLGPEDRLSRECYTMLCDLTKGGAYRGVFCHPPNEAYVGRGKLARLRIALQKSLGMIPGAPDWWLIWDNGAGVIELKVRSKKLVDNQAHFRDWCVEMGIRHAVVLSKEEFYLTLLGWGALRVRSVL